MPIRFTTPIDRVTQQNLESAGIGKPLVTPPVDLVNPGRRVGRNPNPGTPRRVGPIVRKRKKKK